ncbi:hypothetical protein EDD85DRAFT_784182 [Armillaria nabsnona]|nr:hypothetical protein EDD85DRAFT_784182 [Armillaria nabsnona]
MHTFIAFPDHSTSLLSHNKSWRYLQEIRTRHKRTQVELTQTQTNAVERTHAGVERRILLALLHKRKIRLDHYLRFCVKMNFLGSVPFCEQKYQVGMGIVVYATSRYTRIIPATDRLNRD